MSIERHDLPKKPAYLPTIIQRFPDCENSGVALSFYCRMAEPMGFADSFLIGESKTQNCTYLYVLLKEDDPIKLDPNNEIWNLTFLGADLEATCKALPQSIEFCIRYLRPAQVEKTNRRWLMENGKPLTQFKFSDLFVTNELKLD